MTGRKAQRKGKEREAAKSPGEVIREAVERPAEKEKVGAERGSEEAGGRKLEISIDDENMLEIVKRVGVSAGDVARFVEKTKRFLSLPEEERRRRVVAFIEYVATMFKEDSPVNAGKNVLRLLAEVPEAMIYFAYMWKPKFRADVMSLLYHMADAVRRLEQ